MGGAGRRGAGYCFVQCDGFCDVYRVQFHFAFWFMSELPNRSSKPPPPDRRSRVSWDTRLEMAVVVFTVCSASILVYVLLRALCCGR